MAQFQRESVRHSCCSCALLTSKHLFLYFEVLGKPFDVARVRVASAILPAFDRRLRDIDLFCKTVIRLAALGLKPRQILRETQFINSFFSVAPPLLPMW
nr:MAG TPA: hypothetical protein [Caudoviricetes sp.]